MTTIEAAAARSFGKPIALAVMAICASFAFAGCESSNNLFGSAGETAPALADQGTQPPQGQVAKVAIAPLLGPPDNVNKMFQSQLASALERQKLTVAKTPADKSEYTLRGYVVSANEKARTKVSYIWDVTDAAGKQVHRFTGEESIEGTPGKDPWAAISPQIVDTISNKTTASVSGWLGTQPAAGASAPVPVASAAPAAGTPPAPQQTAAASTAPASAPAAVASAAPATAPAAPGPTTGSIGRDAGVNVVLGSVTGAPGDGSVALSNAMQRALKAKGVSLTDKATGQTYKVIGKVAVGQPVNGKQSIQIDWELNDPNGKFYKRVTQKNEIPQGMLDGAWGQTADMAANAAADTIAGLLPKQMQAQAQPTKTN